jgi:hypothetical protein
MFRNISKITASTLKYTASFFSQYADMDMTPDSLDSCFNDIIFGLVSSFNKNHIYTEVLILV